jgi:hypothetical protein
MIAGEGDPLRQQMVEETNCGRGYFLAFLSARFSFRDLVGFFLVSFLAS